MNIKTAKLPKWFKGTCYDEGSTVKNPFSGEEYELNNVELSMYDFIIGSQLVFEMQPKTINPQMIEDFHRGLAWFRKNNIDAYYVLLD